MLVNKTRRQFIVTAWRCAETMQLGGIFTGMKYIIPISNGFFHLHSREEPYTASLVLVGNGILI